MVRIDTFKPHQTQIQLVNEGFYDANRIVRSHIIIEALRHQNDLASILPDDEPLHAVSLQKRVALL